MKTYSLLKQISSENEVEKYSSFPHWLQLTGFLEVLHAHKKEKKKKKKDKYVGKRKKKEGKNKRVSSPYKAADVKMERHSHRN